MKFPISIKTPSEESVQLIFDVSLIIKGINSLLEIAGGLAVLFINQGMVVNFVSFLTQGEISEDPKDFIANHLLRSANQFSVSEQHFIALYLLSYGLVKIFLVSSLLRKKLWSYPVSLVLFSLFAAYQLFRYSHTHSVWLLLVTLLDIVIIGLTWHEYKYLLLKTKKTVL